MESKKTKNNLYSKMTIKELKVLAEQGDAEAQFKLGNRYKQGKGVGKNFRQAVEWLTKAAEQGHSGAQNNLGG